MSKTQAADAPHAAHEPGDRARSVPPNKSPRIADIAIFDRKAFLARVMDDAVIAREILGGYIADMPREIDMLASAEDAGDARSAEQQAHKINGAAASLGGDILRQTAIEMENAGAAGDLESLKILLPRLKMHFAQLAEAARVFIGSQP